MKSSLIQKALQHNLFTLHYQPKINTHTNKVESAEALIRIDTGKEILMPNDFIPQAERSGDIIEIDKWVMRRLIDDARYISFASQEEINIAFNISATHFQQDDFISNMEEIFHYTDDFSSRFSVELTEYSLIKDLSEALKKINKLKKIGFSIALDDFGTGYSSLNYLKDFPFDIIKIDKIFLDGLKSDPKTPLLLEGIIHLAKKLDMHIVAEGVENVDQVTWLYENGCDEIQGYYYSKPLPIDEFIKFVKAVNKPVPNNAFIKWNEKYSVKHFAFDSHHMIIAGILNKIHEELQDKNMQEKSDLAPYCTLLRRYVDIHFQAEEDYMKQHNYKKLQEHVQEHRRFQELLATFQMNLSKSNTKNVYDLFKILKDWFINHELTMDKQFIVT